MMAPAIVGKGRMLETVSLERGTDHSMGRTDGRREIPAERGETEDSIMEHGDRSRDSSSWCRESRAL
jgi:hypothetical protein